VGPPAGGGGATEYSRRDSDPIGEFLADATEPMASASVAAARLYRAYQIWCERNAQDVWSGTRFGKALVERGLRRLKSSFVTYTGITLKPDYDPPAHGGPPGDDFV
jgi:putative DNA primase/helicase